MITNVGIISKIFYIQFVVAERVSNYYLVSANYLNKWMTVLNTIEIDEENILDRIDSRVSEMLRYGDFSSKIF